MNKQEINEMMKDLPSQQLPEETLFQKVIIATIFIVILFLVMWVPDFTLDEEDCMKQESSASVKNICKESKAN